MSKWERAGWKKAGLAKLHHLRQSWHFVLIASQEPGTWALQRPLLNIMLPACYPTAPAEALYWREFDLCSKAPIIRTRPVLSLIDGL